MTVRLLDNAAKVTIRRETRDLAMRMVKSTSVPFYVIVHACLVYSLANLDEFLSWFGGVFLPDQAKFSDDNAIEVADEGEGEPEG